MAEFKQVNHTEFLNNVQYNEYRHPGITDEQVKHVYGMYDSDLDKLMFTNYHKYATIMEKKHLRGGVLK